MFKDIFTLQIKGMVNLSMIYLVRRWIYQWLAHAEITTDAFNVALPTGFRKMSPAALVAIATTTTNAAAMELDNAVL